MHAKQSMNWDFSINRPWQGRIQNTNKTPETGNPGIIQKLCENPRQYSKYTPEIVQKQLMLDVLVNLIVIC